MSGQPIIIDDVYYVRTVEEPHKYVTRDRVTVACFTRKMAEEYVRNVRANLEVIARKDL